MVPDKENRKIIIKFENYNMNIIKIIQITNCENYNLL